MERIYMIAGQRFLRENEAIAQRVAQLINLHPEWTATQVFGVATRHTVQEQVRDSMMLKDIDGSPLGVTVAQPGIMGRLTPNAEGDPGVMSRRNATNAVAIQGGDRASFQRLAAADPQ